MLKLSLKLRPKIWEKLAQLSFSSQAQNQQTDDTKIPTKTLINNGHTIQLDNLEKRKFSGNLILIKELMNQIEKITTNNTTRDDKQINELQLKLNKELQKLPNNTHPDVLNYGDHPKELNEFGTQRNFNFKPKTFDELCKRNNLLRTDHLGNLTGSKSYYLLNDLAEMEMALIKFTVDNLKKYNFQLISVPDILPASVIEGCGMNPFGERNQVYKLDSSENCLSGTAEMAFGAFFSGKCIKELNKPINMMATSRCYRAETSGLQEERGIFRVHNFSKVEMFSVCSSQQSDETLEFFKNIEIQLFQQLGLHFKLLDMPPCELGAPAYRKFDIEAWMPGRQMYGEISSCSNCTDYQAKRLNIQYEYKNGVVEFAHTVNGTACAVPRMLIAILENYQNDDGSINVPEKLQKFMNDKKKIIRSKQLPELKLVKAISSELMS